MELNKLGEVDESEVIDEVQAITQPSVTLESAEIEDIYNDFSIPQSSPTIEVLRDNDTIQSDSDLNNLDTDNVKPIEKVSIDKEDVEFALWLLVSGLDFVFTKGMKTLGKEASTTESQRKRLIKVYSKGLEQYELKVSPIWAMVLTTVIIYGFAAYNAKPIKKTSKQKNDTQTTNKIVSEVKESTREKAKEDDNQSTQMPSIKPLKKTGGMVGLISK
jgi:hypothetical protein